jgi:hypothetical protein
VLAHPLDPAPGRFMVVRACEALDNLDEVGALGFGRRVLPSLWSRPQGKSSESDCPSRQYQGQDQSTV